MLSGDQVSKETKTNRVLLLYDRLNRGEILNKRKLADEFGIDNKSIQRDLDDIRAYWAEYYPGDEVIYCPIKKGYFKNAPDEKRLSGVEILAITKIILESRAFTKDEMNGLIQSITGLVTEIEKKVIKELIGNEIIHFQPITHNKPLLKMIWDICFTIKKQNMIKIHYEKMNGEESQRIIKPVSIIFSEYYFYLIAFIEGSEYQSPAFFRVDRIKSFEILNLRFVVSEKNRVEVGELRKRAQFMYAGELINLRFKFYGPSLTSVLDRFPTAEVLQKLDHGWLIEAEVYGKGCLMWLLSQGEHVEVISPSSIREKLIATLRSMSARYEE